MNEVRLAKVDAHVIHLLVLERHEEDEVPGAQFGAGDQVATPRLGLGGARKGYPRHRQVHPRSQTGAVYATPIQTPFEIPYPKPAVGLSFPGSRGYHFSRREERFRDFAA